MSALQESRAHLAKAREFLEAGVISRDLELFEAATSAAVISGINSKDAICLRLVGVTRRSENHTDAVAELKAVGPAGARLAPTLSRNSAKKSPPIRSRRAFWCKYALFLISLRTFIIARKD